jgi:hypothetical protein
MNVFKPRIMMQEHRQHIKQASEEVNGQLDKPAQIFENALKLLRDLK